MNSTLPLHECQSRLVDACRLLGGRMIGTQCRAPAPGKSRRNDSLVLAVDRSSPYGLTSHLHNAPGDTQAALDVKRYLASALGWTVGGNKAPAYVRPAYVALQDQRAAESAAAKATAAKDVKDQAQCKRIWARTVSIGETLEQYLLATRGLFDLGLGEALATDLRFHPVLAQWAPPKVKGGKWTASHTSPAMVGRITDCSTDRAIGLHLTWLTEDGRKNPDARPIRKMMGRVKGGRVRLGKPSPARGHAVAEGIEDAMAFTTLWGIPCDAALSTAGLESYTPPPGTVSLVIAADNDANTPGNPGMTAAASLAARLAATTIKTRIMPPPRGKDWNDYLLGNST